MPIFTVSSKLNTWGPCLDTEFCVHLYITHLLHFLPIFFLSLVLSFYYLFSSSPLFERGCQALWEHEDENESNLSTEATLSGIFKWDKWHQSKHQFPDISECQEPCRAVAQKSDLPAAILTPTLSTFSGMCISCRRWEGCPIHTAWGHSQRRSRCSLRISQHTCRPKEAGDESRL